uniref:NADH dehydrogenase subunit 5 n=1 Tax=Dracunculus medinensis TaxID=318479 RepID=A0A0N4UKI7_DRAME
LQIALVPLSISQCFGYFSYFAYYLDSLSAISVIFTLVKR